MKFPLQVLLMIPAESAYDKEWELLYVCVCMFDRARERDCVNSAHTQTHIHTHTFPQDSRRCLLSGGELDVVPRCRRRRGEFGNWSSALYPLLALI